jgi:hypothetical protein
MTFAMRIKAAVLYSCVGLAATYVGAFMADLVGANQCFSPRSSGKLVRYEILGEERSLYEVLVWEVL